MSAPAQPHVVIRASAGTGKTFALSNRCLELLRAGHEAESILATTFTRKAAGEILERVMRRLAQAATDSGAAAELARQLGDPALTLTDCRRMLAHLCRSMHRVRIATIDSFFNRVAVCFALELGVPSGATMVGQDDPLARQLRDQAIAATLADDDTHVLLDLLRRLHHDSAQRSVTAAIDRIITDAFETYQQSEASAWRQLAVPPGALNRPALAAAASQLDDLAGRMTDQRFAKALRGNRDAALHGDWEKFLKQGLAGRIVAGETTYHKKPIPADLTAALELIITHARATLIGRLAQQTEATWELLSRFEAHFSVLRHRQRVMLFSDLPWKLARELPQREDVLADIHYRLDSRVGHLLLDEFQDTSLEQWEVLRPLAQEVAAHRDGSRTFFCVGDTKQAIYGWRAGCAELFEQVEHDLNLGDESRRSLTDSYRSSQTVLDAVNRVFTHLPANPALREHADAAGAWASRFEPHRAKHRDRPGYVELVTSPANGEPEPPEPPEPPEHSEDNGEEPDTAVSAHERFVTDHIQRLAAELPGRSIGVLVGANDMVKRLIAHLRQRGVIASGEGGTPPDDDPAVGAILALLTLADHPGDSASAFHVVNSPLGPVAGLKSVDAEHVHRAARAVRAELAGRGYADTIADWARRLAPACSARGAVRLGQLVELAQRFEPEATLRPTDFVRYVEQTPVADPAPAQVRVMTIHKAKGLEFDVVILPHLDRTLLSHRDMPIYLHRPTPTSPIDAVYRATNQVVRSLCPPVEEAYRQQVARRLSDDLSALYVAMTRPRFALHMIIRPLKAKKDGSPGATGHTTPSFAAILRHGLGESEESFEGGQVLFADGDRNWHKKTPVKDQPVARQVQPLKVALAPAPPESTRSWAQVAPSHLAGGGLVCIDDLLPVSKQGGMLYGSLIHQWFEQVPWLDNLPGDEALLASVDEAGRPRLPEFKRMLAAPAVAAALTRPAGADVELWRERSFAVRLDDRLVVGRFDRVVVHREHGQPLRAELVDFKTDAETDPEHHRPQAQLYRRALASLLNLPMENVKATLLFVGQGLAAEIAD